MELPWQSVKRQTDTFVDRVKDQLGSIVMVGLALWAVYGLDFIFYFFSFDFRDWFALQPRKLVGLHGILTMPFVHANLGHLIGNTIGLIFALLALAVLRPKSWMRVLGSVFLLSGVLTWLVGGSGANTRIVGASGVIMGLITFLVAPVVLWIGWWIYNKVTKQQKKFPLEIQLIPFAVGVVASVFYFQHLIGNLVPIPGVTTGGNTSWSAHWCGAIAGLAVAFMFLKNDELDEINDAKQPDISSKSFT